MNYLLPGEREKELHGRVERGKSVGSQGAFALTQPVNKTCCPMYYISVNYFYHSATCYAPSSGALKNHAGRRLEFASRKDAVAYLCEERDEWNYETAMSCEETESGKYSAAGTYFCRHGEYARPMYVIRKVPARRNGAIK